MTSIAKPHQQATIDRYRGKPYAPIFHDMGAGKTFTAIRIFEESACQTALIVGNKGSYGAWLTQIELHSTIPHHVCFWDSDKKASSLKKLASFRSIPAYKGYVIVNIEAIVSDVFCKTLIGVMQKLKRDGVYIICDESTKIKNMKALRTKRMVYFKNLFASCAAILTGTPTPKGALDLWAQFNFLDSHNHPLGYSNYYAYKGRYTTSYALKRSSAAGREYSVDIVTGYKNLDELNEKLRAVASIIKKEECLNLPPKTYANFFVDLTPPQKKALSELRDAWATEVNGTLCTVTQAVAVLTKAQQITSGFLIAEGAVVAIPSNKPTALLELIGEHGGKVFIWATFRYEVEMITNLLQKTYGEKSTVQYYGGTSMKDRLDAVKRMDEDGDTRFIVSNVTGSHGITVLKTLLHIFYSNTFDWGVRAQQEDRSHRIGQVSSVHYVDIVARGSVDERIKKVLLLKEEVASKILCKPKEVLQLLGGT